jgi:hypothetical protein
MSKYFGKIGYGVTEETRPGVYELQIVEKEYYGDIVRNTRRLDNGGKVVDDLNINMTLSIVADPFAFNNFHQLKYVEYMGAKWKATSVEPQYPRLTITLGGVYNGEDGE